MKCWSGSGITSPLWRETSPPLNAGVSIALYKGWKEWGLTLTEAPQKDWLLHEVLLSGWGCPIGELFDLEKLAEYCTAIKRWSFFVSSEVCNVPGGAAR